MGERQLRREDCLYIQFARAPRAGAVKTRMLPHLDPRAACELHCELLAYTAQQLRRLGSQPRELWIAGNLAHPWLRQVAEYYGIALRLQRGADLGERMLHALRDGLSRHQRVVLVGSDCPELDVAYLRDAASRLQHSDMVWGPAQDGGYVLVGARRAAAPCFRGVHWGSAEVMAQTLERARECDVSISLLPQRVDIDRPEDLVRWHSLRDQFMLTEAGSGTTGGLLAQGLRLCGGGD